MAHLHDLHVVPHTIGWEVLDSVHPEARALTRTRDEALALAMRMQVEDPDAGEILIHGPDGEIRERTTIDRKHPFQQHH